MIYKVHFENLRSYAGVATYLDWRAVLVGANCNKGSVLHS